MNQVVRRSNQTLAVAENRDLEPCRAFRGEGVIVESQVSLGVRPEMRLSWSVVPSWWRGGWTLMVFHNTSGFCPEADPDELGRHGGLIVETTEDGSYVLYPEEGLHFFTVMLRKKGLFGDLWESRSQPLRFSQMIPGAKVGIGRIKDMIELAELGHKQELLPIEHEIRRSEAEIRRLRARRQLEALDTPPAKQKAPVEAESIVGGELAEIDAMVEVLFAKRRKVEALKRDPRFLTLSGEEQEAVLDALAARLDPGEINARRSVRGK